MTAGYLLCAAARCMLLLLSATAAHENWLGLWRCGKRGGALGECVRTWQTLVQR